MSEFLVPHDPTPDPRRVRAARRHAAGARVPAAPTLRAAAVRVTSVFGGVRLTFAPTDGLTQADDLAAALAALVERERRDRKFLRFAVEVHPDGAAVTLTITGPSALHA